MKKGASLLAPTMPTRTVSARALSISATSTPASRSVMSRRSGKRGPTYRSTFIPAGMDSTATRAPIMSRARHRLRSAARSSSFGSMSGRAPDTQIGAGSILSLRLQAEQGLPVHAAGRIPVEADMRGGRVGVAPGTLQRLVQEQPLPAGREEQRVDRLHQQPHAERLVAAVAQPHAD